MLYLKLMLVVLLPFGLKCSGVDNLPPLGDAPDRLSPNRDRFQAIVPDYRFQCSGRITEWRACVDPGGHVRELYYIQFQVWRPNGHSECYNLVGFNSPMNNDGSDGVLAPQGRDGDDILHRCVRLSVAVDQQINVQEGDVIGYYVDHFRYENSELQEQTDGGIQWNTDSSSVIVYYTVNLPRDQIKPTYAIDGASPTDCGVPSSDSASYTLSTSMSAAPIISLTFVQAALTTSVIGNMTQSDLSDSTDSKVLASLAAIAIIPLILILSIATILVLLRRRRRKMSKSQLPEYSVPDYKELRGDSVKFPQTTNPANVTNIKTSTNEAYDPISLDTSQNIAYTTNTDISHENERISTDENVAYGTTCNEEFTASENLAYKLCSDTIPISDNPSYGPVERDTNTDLQYDYVEK